MIRSQNLKQGGIFFFKKPNTFIFKKTENALCPKACDIRSMSSLHCLHFSVSLTVATRVSPEKNIEKHQEASQSADCQKNSLLMKVTRMSKAVRYSEARTEGENTYTHSEHFPVRNTN